MRVPLKLATDLYVKAIVAKTGELEDRIKALEKDMKYVRGILQQLLSISATQKVIRSSEVKAECENYAKRLGKALRWMSEDEFDSWLREKFGLPAPTLYTKIRYVAKPIKFFEVRSTPPKLVLRGNLGEQVVEYQGIRFKLIITKL